ncbi:protein of unknown function [Clostridium beijerinckii]|nr:protein of unknown function [Clostridium beijerinckii]
MTKYIYRDIIYFESEIFVHEMFGSEIYKEVKIIWRLLMKV